MKGRLLSLLGAQVAALFFFVLFQGSHLIFSAGCGSSTTGSADGGDSDVEGLEIASQMSVVTPKEESSSSLSSFLQKFAVPTTGDYLTDEANIHVFAPSMEALGEFNFILCYLDQTRYDDMVNQGPYLALVNVTLCEEGEEGEEDMGESSGTASTEEWDSVVVESIRESNEVPQTLRIWITLPPDDPWADTILGEVTIDEGSGPEAPFGIFSANFVELLEGAPVFSGNFSCDRNDEGLIDCGMAMEGEEAGEMHMVMNPDGSEGKAYMHFQFTDFDDEEGTEEEVEEEGRMAFDNDHFLSHFDGHEGLEKQCFDRNSFENHVWRYNLYAGDGARVDRNSGFPIVYGAEEDQRYGWFGYWGIWLPEDIAIVDGMSVRNPETGEDYLVRVGGGRLIKRERSELTLNDFLGDILNHWDDETQTVWLVMWDGTNILKFGEEMCNEDGCTMTDQDPEIIALEANEWFGMWKNGFGYLDLVVPEDGTPDGDQAIPFYQESFVLLDDPLLDAGDLTLQCYFNCLEAPIIDSNNPFTPESFEVNEDSEPILYTFNPETYSLFDPDGVEVTWEASVEEGGSYSWGAMSGAMVTADTELEDPWNIWNEPTTFMYEVGPNHWNRMSMVVDSSGAPIHFEEPFHCLYHDDEEGTFYIDYEGLGELRIPSEESDDGHWTPLFSIADGSEVICDGTPYYTRAMEIEQIMEEVDLSECNALSIEDIGPPTNEIGEVAIGDQPTLASDEPAVIAGELQ